MTYEQEWAQHQALLKEVDRLNKELQAAEAARNAANQHDLQEGQQSHIRQLEAKVEQLQEGKAAAETRVSAFELQVAQENPEHARWLEEQLPPAPEFKSKEAYIDLGLEIAENVAEHAEILESFGGSPVTDPIVQGLEYIREHKDALSGYAAGWVQDKIETVKEYIGEKDPAKEWEKQIEKDEKAINEKFDKEIRETEKSLQKQLEYIQKKYDHAIEKETKMNELQGTIEKVKGDIEKDRAAELENIERRKDIFEKTIEATKGMEERQRIIEQQKELDRKLELERQRQLEEQNREQ